MQVQCTAGVRSHGVNETFLNQLSHKPYQFNRKTLKHPSLNFSYCCFFFFFCFTVTDAGSNSGIFGTTGSGGLAGAGAGADAGLGSSFFLGAMARSSEESGRGATRQRETEQTQDETRPPSQKSQASLFSEHRYLHPPSWLQQ